MAQRLPIVAELKRALKERGLTYAHVARRLKLSEASVKRLFSRADFSLERLDEICDLLRLELSDLVTSMRERLTPVTRLSLAQEREIVGDPRLLLMTWLVLNRWRIEEIRQSFRLTDRDIQRCLIRLDRLGIIELQPGNRARLRITQNLSWNPGGPMQRFLHQKPLREFFDSDFSDPRAELRFFGSVMSDSTLAQIRKAIEQTLRECADLADRDRSLPLEQRTGAAYVFAVRPWHYSGFDQFRK